eukprot:TRINITY_DN2214_c0_g1_i1.p1 TRINITY_DN2214_c0_g1~~TRINITY_DN2214_c0_g1_i1.p1  ORF type:complete len:234 (-),score=29.08 TRINITY_DN2214_c0_g1_i1:157-858(-)
MKVIAIILLLVVTSSCRTANFTGLYQHFKGSAEHIARIVEILKGKRADNIKNEARAAIEDFTHFIDQLHRNIGDIFDHFQSLGYETQECFININHLLTQAKSIRSSLHYGTTGDKLKTAQNLLESSQNTYLTCRKTLRDFDRKLFGDSKQCFESVVIVESWLSLVKKKRQIEDVIREIPELASITSSMVEVCGIRRSQTMRDVKLYEARKKPNAINRLFIVLGNLMGKKSESS